MEKWAGKVALVTGASAGIGAAISRSLVNAGVKVVGAARNLEKMEKLRDDLSGSKGILFPVKCDVTKDDQVEALFQTIKTNFGGVDICVNNAGIAIYESLTKGSISDWRSMMDVNVISLCLCTKLSIENMRQRGVDDGHIIHISSMSGHRSTSPELSFYACTKTAVKVLAEGLRMELRQAKSRIRVTCISPGFVETDMITNIMGEEGAKKMLKDVNAIQPSEIADVVISALSAPPHVEINDILMRPTNQVS